MAKWEKIETAPEDGVDVLVARHIDWHGWVYEVASKVAGFWTCTLEPSHWKAICPPDEDAEPECEG